MDDKVGIWEPSSSDIGGAIFTGATSANEEFFSFAGELYNNPDIGYVGKLFGQVTGVGGDVAIAASDGWQSEDFAGVIGGVIGGASLAFVVSSTGPLFIVGATIVGSNFGDSLFRGAFNELPSGDPEWANWRGVTYNNGIGPQSGYWTDMGYGSIEVFAVDYVPDSMPIKPTPSGNVVTTYHVDPTTGESYTVKMQVTDARGGARLTTWIDGVRETGEDVIVENPYNINGTGISFIEDCPLSGILGQMAA